MHSTFSRERHSRTIFAPFIIFWFTVKEFISLTQRAAVQLKTTCKQKNHCARALVPPPVALISLKSGRSGGAGYTDPNNNKPDRDKCGREIDVRKDCLVGFRIGHQGLSKARIS